MVGKQRAAIYVRISRDRVGAGLGVERQENECRELADNLNAKVVVVEVDNDLSAYSGKPRPGYIRLLRLMREGEIDLVLAWHTDRIHRTPMELEEYIDVCEPRSLPTHTVTAGPIDLTTPAGRMAARVYCAVARYEVEHIIERITLQKKEAAKAGRWSGGGRPYGYEKDGKTIRESEAQVVRDCVNRLIAGESQVSVVRWLNESGRLTSTGKRWMIGNFRTMITKKRYCGIREHVPEHGGPRSEYPAEWPGVITVEDHELLMARLRESAQPWNHGPVKGRTYLLSGLAFCGSCGSAMYGQARTTTSGRQRRYRCRPYDNHSVKVGCGKVFRDAKAMDAFISEAVLTRFDSPEVAAALASDGQQTEAQALASELMRLKVRRKDIAKRLALASADEEQDIAVMLDTVRDAIQATQTRLGKLQANKTAGLLPKQGTLREVWDRSGIEWRRDVIKLIIGRIEVHPVTTRGRGFNPDFIKVSWTH